MLNKEQAAAALGITVRTLQRHMAAHRIGFAMRRTVTGEEATFSETEVVRFKAERDALTTTVTSATTVSEVVRDAPTQALQRAPSEQSMTMFVAALSDALRGAGTQRNGAGGAASVSIGDKLMLSIDEAAALAGLSANHIYVAIRAGKLKAKIVGRGWRVKRPDLDAYVKKL
jgi:excisionase family DNA binding protein